MKMIFAVRWFIQEEEKELGKESIVITCKEPIEIISGGTIKIGNTEISIGEIDELDILQVDE